MTGDTTGLIGTRPPTVTRPPSTTARVSRSRPSLASSAPSTSTPAGRAEHDAPGRQGAADHGQGGRHLAGRGQPSRLAYTVPAGNLFAVGTARTRPEIYAMGFRNPFRITLDKNDVAYVTDYSPDSRGSADLPRAAGTGRVEVVRGPANYGWPLCRRPTCRTTSGTSRRSTPLPNAAAPEPHECENPNHGPQNTSRWVASGGPAVEPGLEDGPSDHQARDLVLVPGQPGARRTAP